MLPLLGMLPIDIFQCLFDSLLSGPARGSNSCKENKQHEDFYLYKKMVLCCSNLFNRGQKTSPTQSKVEGALRGSLWKDGCRWLGGEDLTHCTRTLLLMTSEDFSSSSLIVVCWEGGFSPLEAANSRFWQCSCTPK
jgi:hypothetical protein